MNAMMKFCKRSYPLPCTDFTADLETIYCFPLHIALTDLHPDTVWWDDSEKQLWLAELTVCFETSFEEARERKEAKYSELVAAINNTTLIWGGLTGGGGTTPPRLSTLAQELAISHSQQDLSSLLHQCCQALAGSHHRLIQNLVCKEQIELKNSYY